ENFTDLQNWAREQWGDADLGDRRRTDRAIAVGAAIAANPQGSIPQIMSGWNELRAAYRLMGEEDVTHSALLKPHAQATKNKARVSGLRVVLFIQDTTELDYTAQKQISGLGEIGDGRGRGIMLHSCLAVVPTPTNPEIVGVAGQIPWMRGEINIEEKESSSAKLFRSQSEGEIWAEMLDDIGSPPDENTGIVWVSVGDRGSDIFSYIRRAQSDKWHCLLRVTQNRVITTPEGNKGYLKSFARTLAPMALKTLVLRGRDGEPKRSVNLQVAWSPIIIQPPQTGPERKQQPISGCCLRCWEVGGELEWILFTTFRVNDVADALTQLDWYACRWVIEEYHKCLKSGCAIEKRQLETGKGLVRLLGFLCVVAVRLLQLRTISRHHPEVFAREFVPELMLKVLVARLGLFSNDLTLGQFWTALARLGGFIGRKSDGLPGWQTLWRGWLRLQDISWGADFASSIV
ncbi:MAG: IS4 family transposase, partial [Nitrososphaera sp.]|nr:IS4 family transposase [Nitrososphaera sp.]